MLIYMHAHIASVTSKRAYMHRGAQTLTYTVYCPGPILHACSLPVSHLRFVRRSSIMLIPPLPDAIVSIVLQRYSTEMKFHEKDFIGEKFFVNTDAFSHKTIHRMSGPVREAGGALEGDVAGAERTGAAVEDGIGVSGNDDDYGTSLEDMFDASKIKR